jgi:hypothetical protein
MSDVGCQMSVGADASLLALASAKTLIFSDIWHLASDI